MKEMLEEILNYFKSIQVANCQCVNCIKAREWINKIEEKVNES